MSFHINNGRQEADYPHQLLISYDKTILKINAMSNENEQSTETKIYPALQCREDLFLNLSLQDQPQREYDFQEKYITYIPHSGFANQRISLTNAILLAWSTNRTLIVPPIILGKSVSWQANAQLETLISELIRSTKNISECELLEKKYRRICYRNLYSYTLLPWDQLFDMSFIKNHVRMINRPDFSPRNLESSLNIREREREIFYLENSLRRKPIFRDFTPNSIFNKSSPKEVMNLCDLRSRPEKLVQLRSVFGTKRVMFSLPKNKLFQESFEKKMVFSHPVVIKVANDIVQKLGGVLSFIGVHLRIGDSNFQEARLQTVQEILKMLDEAIQPKKHNEDGQLGIGLQHALSKCVEKNQLIYIATDAMSNDPILIPFFEKFPCVVTLANFSSQLSPLNELKNPIDNFPMGKFLIPMVELLVVAQSRRFFGTSGSTFSGFAQLMHQNLVQESENEGWK
ncbi:hypothetical protein G9A89_023135 [Geosiphon pyriformis]|nr:hypothetical protein G9A89_023135 [Geosiphon pyriformis]